jgi:hypothetical protein
VFLLAAADKRLGLIDRLAGLIPDAHDPAQITHSMADILRERVFAIACGYPDGNDLDDLRHDPAFKIACGRLPNSGVDLASQPTISRLENAPDLRTLIRMSRGMVDFWCQSHPHPPNGIVLDIDDTADTVHGHQQMSWFNAHYDERCFLPIHIYHAATGHCVVTILPPVSQQLPPTYDQAHGGAGQGKWLDTVRSSKSAWSRDCCRRRVRRWKRCHKRLGSALGRWSVGVLRSWPNRRVIRRGTGRRWRGWKR